MLAPLQWNLPSGWQLGASPEADMIRNADRGGYHAALSAPVSLTHALRPGLLRLHVRRKQFTFADAIFHHGLDRGIQGAIAKAVALDSDQHSINP